MAKASEQPLQPNPFNTYRDPKTGLWVVVQNSGIGTHHCLSEKQNVLLDPKNSMSNTYFEIKGGVTSS
jgi:hypothetical protein